MSVKVSVFDFFSYTIPGLLFLSIFWYLDYSFFNCKHTYFVNELELNLFSFILLLVIAYIVGLIMDKVAYIILWKRFVKPLKKKTLEFLKNEYKDYEIKLNLHYYNLYRTRIAKNDKEFFDTLERFYATSHLLSNVSFALLLVVIIEIILAIRDFFSINHIIFAMISICSSLISLTEGNKYRSWAITGVFNYMIDSNLSYENVARKKTNNDS